MALLQSFNDSSAPSAKRRKLEHQEPSQNDPDPQLNEESEEAEKRDIDEADEAEEPAIEEQAEDDSDNEIDTADPFDVHFASPDDELSARGIKAAKAGEWTTKRAMVQPWRATLITPGTETTSPVPEPVAGLNSLHLKQKLQETASKKMTTLDAASRAFLPLLFNYQDILFCDRTVENSTKLKESLCLHALNHVFK